MVKNTPGPEPHRAIYGFSFNLFFTTLFLLYVIWVLPYPTLGYTKHFYFVPDTYFAFSCPMFVLCGLVFFLFFYASVNMAQSADIESSVACKDSTVHCECLQEDDPNDSKVDAKIFNEVHNFSKPTSFALDVDLSHVSKVLYNRSLNE